MINICKTYKKPVLVTRVCINTQLLEQANKRASHSRNGVDKERQKNAKGYCKAFYTTWQSKKNDLFWEIRPRELHFFESCIY